MFYCKPVVLEELEEIQKAVLASVPKEVLKYARLFYLENNREIFLSIDPLRKFLEKKGWMDKLNKAGFALNIVGPKSETAIHIDSGNFPYSFNIPISHCRDSFLNFYKVKYDISEMKLNLRKTPWASYYRFEKEDCEVVKSYELSTPFIMNTKLPHGVTNISNDNRVTLLVRLNPIDPKDILITNE
jgi:hypothetical protein